MKRETLKFLITVGIFVCLTIALSIALGVTPAYVKQFKYEQETKYESVIDKVDTEHTDETSSLEEFLNNLPEYEGNPFVLVNGNRPFFTDDEKNNTDEFINLSELDKMGRTGVAYANLTIDSMPTEPRSGDLSTVTPSGFKQVDTRKWNVTLKIGDYETPYFYARCHEIAYSLCSIEVDERILFTGTEYLNQQMKVNFEEPVLDFLDQFKDSEKSDHVLYRVTPCFKDDELVCRGVLMECYSVEAKGLFLDSCMYFFNVQPGFTIDYKTGEVSIDAAKELMQ